jgi:ankyrin repeat protein
METFLTLDFTDYFDISANGNLEELQNTLNKNLVDLQGRSLLHAAVHKGNLENLRFLLDKLGLFFEDKKKFLKFIALREFERGWCAAFYAGIIYM